MNSAMIKKCRAHLLVKIVIVVDAVEIASKLELRVLVAVCPTQLFVVMHRTRRRLVVSIVGYLRRVICQMRRYRGQLNTLKNCSFMTFVLEIPTRQ